MEAERENYVSDEEEEVTAQKKEITVNKLRLSIKLDFEICCNEFLSNLTIEIFSLNVV